MSTTRTEDSPRVALAFATAQGTFIMTGSGEVSGQPKKFIKSRLTFPLCLPAVPNLAIAFKPGCTLDVQMPIEDSSVSWPTNASWQMLWTSVECISPLLHFFTELRAVGSLRKAVMPLRQGLSSIEDAGPAAALALACLPRYLLFGAGSAGSLMLR